MWKDPIVEEVRKQRLKIEAECENDFDMIFAEALKVQEKVTSKIVSKPIPKESSDKISKVG